MSFGNCGRICEQFMVQGPSRAAAILRSVQHLLRMNSNLVGIQSDIIKSVSVRTIFETLDTRLLDTMCDVNTEGKHNVRRKHSKCL